jgi:hypothetical protein
MLTMSAMLAIGLTLTGLFIGKLRSAANARNSTIAIYAADSATEMCLYEARSGVPLPKMDLGNDSSYEIVGGDEGEAEGELTDDVPNRGCETLDSGLFSFRATGIYRGVRRTLEITQ